MNQSPEHQIPEEKQPQEIPVSVDISQESPEKEQLRKRIVDLAKEIIADNGIFPFSGMDPEVQLLMRTTDEDFPGYTTPIDEIVGRLEDEGMKIMFGLYPESGMVYILPLQSNDFVKDSIEPKHLVLNDTIRDERLRELIALNKRWKQ